MKKVLILILGLTLSAASCDLVSGTFDFGSGAKGVFKSTDSGSTFHSSGIVKPKGNLSSVTVTSLAFDPLNPDIIYAASTSGVFKTTDNADTWQFILSGITATDISIDPQDSQVLYVAGLSGSNGKIVKSMDAGASWTDAYTEPSKNNAVQSIVVAPTSHSVVIAGLTSGEILRSNDSGQTWQTVADFTDRIGRIRFGSGASVYAISYHKGLEKSSDLGLTWASVTDALVQPSISGANQGASSVSLFYDLGLDKRQAGVIYLGTEQGLYRSVNDGANWAFIKLPLKNASLRTSAVAVDPNNSNTLYVAVASTILESNNGGLSWQTKVLPITDEVRTIIFHPQSSNIIYVGVGAKR
ncbi:MAG TPA: hypothetical protein VL306_02015 [Methylomirabilota bacterium]|nr:hypothetical protein [Methylomirabilota bacterium]